ncbi:class I SAM-dependent methyltransferase [Marinobacter sp. M216]|uniref:Class I SAM-dependent methyltransferase n=1 Tax=Marinobacter albus TaxID=3030833 RepID=A0ABT7HAJ8_9GAMM|nr:MULTISPECIES: class I SAM-dependent methyltransferase [unclassified Marinobacter]MBW7470356.1 class I SAM-dependent methyltransferase [Marinobacter sp. F4218]MDK9557379.1 class I SAM-dependent methyltransferase [Marinobacter sp. M216]
MSTKPTDSSGISFTALYTGAVWHRYGLSDDALATQQGRWLYHLMTPFEAASKAAIGGNIRTFLLQRHLIIDHLIDEAINHQGIDQVLEIACGMSPRGIRLRQRHPRLHMVEADLPDMAGRKALRLLATGRLGDHHQVTPIDILAERGEYCLEQVIDRVFDNTRPVIIVTEGLTSYFSLAVISDFWRRLAAAMAKRPGSLYLSESYYRPKQPLLDGTLRALGSVLGAATRSQVSFHFRNDDEARQHFLACGFRSTRVHDPRAWYGTLPIPESRGEPMVRVIEARS